MANLLEPLFQQIPWAKPAVAWLLFATIILIVSTLPAYLVLLPIARIIRGRFSEFADWLSEVSVRHSEESQKTREHALDLYTSDHLLMHLVTAGKTTWGRAVSEAMQTADQIRKAVSAATSSADHLIAELPAIHDKLKSLDTIVPKDLPSVGDPSALQADIFRLRVARTQFAGAAFLVLALVAVNTGMLSQILGGLISQSIVVFGIPLYYLFAALITTVESGLGYAHGVFSESEVDATPRISFSAIAMTGFGIGIALVEGFFYSRIHPNRADTVTIPFVNYTIAQSDIYFMWGFLLVMSLFSLGLITYRARVKMLKQTSSAVLKGELVKLKRNLTDWAEALHSTISLAEKAQQQTKEQLKNPSAKLGLEAIQNLINQLPNIEEPSWTQNTRIPLGKAELRSLVVRAGAWFVIALLAALVFVVCSTISLGIVVSALPLPLGATIGLGLATLMFVAGLLAGNNEIVLETKHDAKILAPIWSRSIGISLIVAFEIISALILVLNIKTRSALVLGLLNMVIPLGIFASAYQLEPLMSLAALAFNSVRAWLIYFILFLLRAFARIVETIALVFEHIAATLASPWTHLFGRTVAPPDAAGLASRTTKAGL